MDLFRPFSCLGGVWGGGGVTLGCWSGLPLLIPAHSCGEGLLGVMYRYRSGPWGGPSPELSCWMVDGSSGCCERASDTPDSGSRGRGCMEQGTAADMGYGDFHPTYPNSIDNPDPSIPSILLFNRLSVSRRRKGERRSVGPVYAENFYIRTRLRIEALPLL